MFRNPRENSSATLETSVKPSTGRPPTPPNGSQAGQRQPLPKMTTRTSSNKHLTPRPNSKPKTPTIGRQASKKGPTGGGKPNGNILSFFKKVDLPIDDDGLFIGQEKEGARIEKSFNASFQVPDFLDGDIFNDAIGEEDDRYNESGIPVKRRRLSRGSGNDEGPNRGSGSAASNHSSIDEKSKYFAMKSSEAATATAVTETCTPPPPPSDATISKPMSKQIGGFFVDSESEDEEEYKNRGRRALQKDPTLQKLAVQAEEDEVHRSLAKTHSDENNLVTTMPVNQEDIKENRPVHPRLGSVCSISDKSAPEVPSLKAEQTSYGDYGAFDDIEAYPDDDEFLEGEEFAEKKWMEEQAMLEDMDNSNSGNFPSDDFDATKEELTASCPICDTKLSGITEDEASRHVNACLDGKPIPFPTPTGLKQEPKETKMMPVGAGSRFSRAAVARPGQASPFELSNSGPGPSTAFSKLMASHAEDAAWANAAAAEHAARGKQAYQRTCPFYKIMPGFYICVDAFRYGAVEGCNAYFLSHFHSDHYVGLTSTWCHGPIYCSKVTANLVKQQLRVDPKWVVPLNFEERIEVPGTQGVSVTMIPANHCPGSSLFLFEKIVGKGVNPKVQRVLHCGDFRACPAHIAHPLLMPDIVDSITGKTKQQKIDVCYLDTTYLNPRYAFPSQEDVINSCADMCVSLKKERAEISDAWEVVKKERAGVGMANFVGTSIKSEDSIAMEVGSSKQRGRLLVICGTYSIGKERICMGIARALDCKIWAPPGKQRICAALEDPELTSRLTDDPKEAQVHMQMLMEIRAETLQDYLNGYKPHFSRIVGFRPSGWNYRPPNSRFVESPSIQTVLMSDNWHSRYSMAELIPQRGSTREASCFGVPYSEHSSFRELTMFCCALRIEKIIPTVNVGSAPGRAKMKTWIDRWLMERRKNGVIKIGNGDGMVKW